MSLTAPNVLATGNNMVAGTSFSFTAAAPPSAGSRVLAAVRTNRASGAIAPLAFAALGLTWVQKASVLNSVASRLTVYEAAGVATGDTSVNIDVNDGGGNHATCAIVIVEHPSCAGSVQQGTSAPTTGTFTTTTLPAGVTPGNGVGHFATSLAAAPGVSAESGYTLAVNLGAGGGGGAARMGYQWRADSADNTPTMTATSGGNGPWIGIAFELAGSGGPAPTLKRAQAHLAGRGSIAAHATRHQASRLDIEAGTPSSTPTAEVILDSIGAEVL